MKTLVDHNDEKSEHTRMKQNIKHSQFRGKKPGATLKTEMKSVLQNIKDQLVSKSRHSTFQCHLSSNKPQSCTIYHQSIITAGLGDAKSASQEDTKSQALSIGHFL